jgi:O-antigen ligase
MTSIAGERQSISALVMVAGVAVAVSLFLASADTRSSVVIIFGAMACVLAFMNAELSIYFLIVAMLLSPELEVGQTEQGASLGRAVTLRIDDFLILVISVTWFLKCVLYKEINLLKGTSLNAAIFMYVPICVLSTMLGMLGGQVAVKTGSLFVLKYIEYFVIFFMAVNITRDKVQLRRFLVVVFLVAAIVAIVGIAQIPSGQRVSAPFEGKNGEPNTLGGYLLLMLGTLGGIALVDKRYRVLTVPLLGAMMMAFLYTLSRASYLGFIPLLVLLPMLTRKFLMLAAVSVFLIVAIAVPQSVLPPSVVKRIAYTFTQKTTNEQANVFGRKVDTSTTARLIYMQAAVEAFFDHPVLGWGVTGWHFLDSQYFRTLVETGLLGLSSFLFLLFRVFQVTMRAREAVRGDPLLFGFTSGFLAGFVGLLVHAIGSNTFIIVRIMEPCWLFVALICILSAATPRPGGQIVLPV